MTKKVKLPGKCFSPKTINPHFDNSKSLEIDCFEE